MAAITKKNALPEYSEALIQPVLSRPKGHRGPLLGARLIELLEAFHYDASLLDEEDMDAVAKILRTDFVEVYLLAE